MEDQTAVSSAHEVIAVEPVIRRVVAARNGFWIGTHQARIWVQLVGPLRPLHVHAGDRVRFDGVVTGNPPAYPGSIGAASSDIRLLSRQGAHLTVNTTTISVQD